MSFETAEKWINTCIQKHSNCGSGLEAPLPTRILDVSLDSVPPIVRLVETKSKHARYACLSHCWGTNPTKCQSNHKTIAIHQQGIMWESMPKTFQDAVVITRRLGIKFLWIDSLCILQDNEDDWQNESEQMAAYYQNAYITICAAWANDDDQGCFSIASPEHMAKKIETVHTDNAQHSIYVRKPLPHFNGHLMNTMGGRAKKLKLGEPMIHFPPLSRGWVYQERLLSPRVLYFGPAELLWECHELTSCECMPDDIHHENLESAYFKAGSGTFQWARRRGPRKVWRKMVEEYTKLRLTFEKDKLPAISGAAKQLQSVRNERYLAGLWEKSLLLDLLWITLELDLDGGFGSVSLMEQYNLGHYGRPQKWRAPTWSWASVLGPIKWPYNAQVYNVHPKVLQVDCEPLGKDSTGGVSSGYIVISGLLFPAEHLPLELRGELGETLISRASDKEIKVHADIPFGDVMNRDSQPEPKELFQCLILASSSSEHELCLILKCINTEQQIYERVGIGRVFFGPDDRWGEDYELEDLELPADTKQVTIKIV
jgi:heterokaryon incompatibility protein (HET)